MTRPNYAKRYQQAQEQIALLTLEVQEKDQEIDLLEVRIEILESLLKATKDLLCRHLEAQATLPADAEENERLYREGQLPF